MFTVAVRPAIQWSKKWAGDRWVTITTPGAGRRGTQEMWVWTGLTALFAVNPWLKGEEPWSNSFWWSTSRARPGWHGASRDLQDAFEELEIASWKVLCSEWLWKTVSWEAQYYEFLSVRERVTLEGELIRQGAQNFWFHIGKTTTFSSKKHAM